MKFNRGYSEVDDKIGKSKFLKSCYNCGSFYQAVGDKKELCQDNQVLQYDMVVTETQVYCSHWRPVTKSKGAENGEKKSIFKTRKAGS